MHRLRYMYYISDWKCNRKKRKKKSKGLRKSPENRWAKIIFLLTIGGKGIFFYYPAVPCDPIRSASSLLHFIFWYPRDEFTQLYPTVTFSVSSCHPTAHSIVSNHCGIRHAPIPGAEAEAAAEEGRRKIRKKKTQWDGRLMLRGLSLIDSIKIFHANAQLQE